jgi:carbonic anhydrase/acetyltransferase-like protein (isoleucine patch superfamily)
MACATAGSTGSLLIEYGAARPGSLVAGVPGKVRRELTPDELEGVRDSARRSTKRAREYAQQAGYPPRSSRSTCSAP